jgi:leucyl aminopeptidase
VFYCTDVDNVRPLIVGLAPGAGLIWAAAGVSRPLPEGRVYLFCVNLPERVNPAHVEIGRALGAYAFDMVEHKSNGDPETEKEILVRLCTGSAAKRVDHALGAIYVVRDRISTPAECLTPASLAAAAQALEALHCGASCRVVVGDAFLEPHTYYPQVHTLGALRQENARLVSLTCNRIGPRITGRGM